MSGQFFIIVAAARHNFGEHWRVRARWQDPFPPVRTDTWFISHRGLVVPVSDYEIISDQEIECCIDYDLPGAEADYVGQVALDLTGRAR